MKITFRLFFLLATLVGGLWGYADETATCEPAENLRQIEQDFEFVNNNEELIPDICNPENLYGAAIRAIQFIKALPAAPAMPPGAEFENEIIGGNVYDYFQTRIHRIVFEPPQSSSCGGGALAYVRLDLHDNTMRVCPRFLQGPPLFLSYVMIHEARHTEGDGFMHSSCINGPYSTLAGLACDISYQNAGGYAAGVEYLIKVSRMPELSAEIRQTARSQAVVDFMERFAVLPMEMHWGALLQAENGGISFWDTYHRVPMVEGAEQNDILVSAGPGRLPIHYNKSRAEVKSCGISSVCEYDATGKLAQEFRQLSQERREALLDVHYGPGNYSCFLFVDSLYCSNGAESLTKEMPFVPSHFLATYRSALVENDTLLISDMDGYTYALPKEFSELEGIQLVPSEEPQNYRTVSHWARAVELVVKGDGTLAFFNQVDGQWYPTRLGEERFKKVLALFAWSPRLNDI